MSSARMASQVPFEPVAQGRSRLRTAAAGTAVATFVNSAIWLGGRAADVSFAVPGSLVPEVDLVSVILATPLIFAVGWGLLTMAAARGSRRWERILLVGAAGFAVLSSAAPLTTAADTASGVLLAAMHLETGTVFLVTAAIARGR